MGGFCIIRVISSISETNAPYNQFTLYRYKYCKGIRQVLIICSKTIPETLFIPDDLDIKLINMNYNEIFQTVKQEYRKCEDNGEKVVIHLHHPDSAVLFLLHTLFFGNNMRAHTVYNVHNSFTSYPYKVKALVGMCIYLAKKICVVSKSAYATYPWIIRAYKGRDMLPIQNGFDDVRVMSQYDKTAKRNYNELIYVARMAPQKNHQFLINLIEKLPSCKLVLVGVEDKQGKIRKLVEEKELQDRVEFVGLITRNEVFNRLNFAGMYVTPSLIEGLPVSLLEAACSGLVCVTSNIPSHLEVAEKVESIKALDLDVDLWARAISKFLEDREALEKLGKIGQSQVIENFSLKHMNEQYDDVYKSIVGDIEC